MLSWLVNGFRFVSSATFIPNCHIIQAKASVNLKVN